MIDPSSRLAWEDAFFAELKQGKTVRDAKKAAGVSSSTLYRYRVKSRRFAQEWQAIRTWKTGEGKIAAAAAGTEPCAEEAPADDTPRRSNWRAIFFDALAETSNIHAAAAQAKVSSREIYKLRRDDRDFAAKWQAALSEGYDNLEMELVGYLRDSAPTRKLDVSAALRLLSAHRETVERRRALTSEEDEKATVEALDAFFEGLRQRRIANEAALLEQVSDDDGDQ